MSKKPATNASANQTKKEETKKTSKGAAAKVAPAKQASNKQEPPKPAQPPKAAETKKQVQPPQKEDPKKINESKKVSDQKKVTDQKKVPEQKKTEEPKKVPEPKKKVDEESDDSSDSDEMPELVNAADAAGADDASKFNHSRSERKAIKAMTKLGLKHVKDIVRVTIRRTKTFVFVISPAEVYKASGVDTYIIFGEAKMEDMSAQAQLAVQEKLKNLSKEKDAVSTQPTIKEESDEDDDAEVDAEGLEEGDISLVMTQASVSRKKAVKTLKEANGDIVNAIMNLTV